MSRNSLKIGFSFIFNRFIIKSPDRVDSVFDCSSSFYIGPIS